MLILALYPNLFNVSLINKFMKDGIKILDCSSGPGTYSLYLAKNFNCNIVSTDLVEKYIEELNVRKRKENLKGSIQTLNLNAANLSRFKDDTFDIVLCMGAYYHLIDDISRECCLKECIRVLKKNGYLFLTYLPLSFILKFFALNIDMCKNCYFAPICGSGCYIRRIANQNICYKKDIYQSLQTQINNIEKRKKS